MSKSNPKTNAAELPDAELDVLACLWKRGQATAREVRDDLDAFRPMAHGSAVTLLNRLLEKGLVTREKAPVGKAFIYKPTRRPEPTYRRIVGDLVRRVFGGNRVALVSSLFESEPPTPEQISELQDLLDELKAKSAKEESTKENS